mmetsp:Transcript_4858/g.7351  ORF Transcript_4858/g.7351 Transcript_4858/m.7351 type:complete len:98 (+) Transcript_4858:1057-1350(+)
MLIKSKKDFIRMGGILRCDGNILVVLLLCNSCSHSCHYEESSYTPKRTYFARTQARLRNTYCTRVETYRRSEKNTPLLDDNNCATSSRHQINTKSPR